MSSGKIKISIIKPEIHTIDEQFRQHLSKNGYNIKLVVPHGSGR